MAVVKIVPMPGVRVTGPTGAPGLDGEKGADGFSGRVYFHSSTTLDLSNYTIGDPIEIYKHPDYEYVAGTPFLIRALRVDNVNPATGGALLHGFVSMPGASDSSMIIVITRITGVFGSQNFNYWDYTISGEQGPAGEDGLLPTSGTWDTKFAEKSGITGATYSSPDMELGQYYTVGDLVFIDVYINLNQPTSWGNEYDTFIGELPFPISPAWQQGVDSRISRNYLKGRYYALADADPLGAPWEADETGNIDMSVTLFTSYTDNKPMFALYATDSESLNTNAETLRLINADWPINLRVPNNLTIAPNPRMNIRFSGVYRKA